MTGIERRKSKTTKDEGRKTKDRNLSFVARSLSFVLLAALLALVGAGAAQARPEDNKIRVLLITGGHDFEHEPFLAVFRENPEISFEEVTQPKAQERFRPDAARPYDVIVLYDMWPEIGEEAKADFVNLLKQGKGLVALHHSIADYPNWDEYSRIIGAKYYLQKQVVNGVEKPVSIFQHGVRFTVRIADPKHPVTRGLKDFEILDETYGKFEVAPKVKPLLTTDTPTSGPIIGWVRNYGKARVVYLQLGHDHTAYEDPNYRRLVAQAIRWAAKRGR
jgi:type 1 glutamine amidotransferase